MAKKSLKTKRNTRQPKPLKLATLVVSAIEELKESKGATPRKIVGYLTYATQLPVAKIKRQVNSVLKKGVQYGILRRFRGHYYLPKCDPLERANKIAERFAQLPSVDSVELLSDFLYPLSDNENNNDNKQELKSAMKNFKNDTNNGSVRFNFNNNNQHSQNCNCNNINDENFDDVLSLMNLDD
ncbi:uncharacterized protein DDB_G0289917-like [Leptopilina boulardi]|uniref:uncharacterized protein DDB_G0289917-like n=1 Tax=Leptopilina boulardi TaxID=63433 RepID=UPI0021F5C789|nr:uncharacterized protein DDB_G0289917-like [Leptopilina boulardi]